MQSSGSLQQGEADIFADDAGWLNDTRSYVPPVKIGEVMRAGGVGKVAAVGKEVKNVAVGDYVYATCGTPSRLFRRIAFTCEL